MAFIDEGAKRECEVAMAEVSHNIRIAKAAIANNEFEKAEARLVEVEKFLRQAKEKLVELCDSQLK